MIGTACWSREGSDSTKGWPNSILASNDLSQNRIDYGNDNGNGNDCVGALEVAIRIPQTASSTLPGTVTSSFEYNSDK